MTQDEAKTKWCPMVRQPSAFVVASGMNYVSPSALGINREQTTGGPPIARCIASECMMWRETNSMASGYCGLAGRLDIL